MKTSDVEVFILVGGMGTRLRGVVSDVPKPMAPIADKPFLSWLLIKLKKSGFKKIRLLTGYKHEIIQEYFKDGDDFGLDISYSVETRPLGTGGAMVNAIGDCTTDFVLLLNGDTFVDIDYSSFFSSSKKDCVASLALVEVNNISRYGAVTINNACQVTSFIEKNVSSEIGLINAGIYLINIQKIEFPSLESFSFETIVLPDLVERGVLFGFVEKCGFIDIGIPDDFKKAQSLIPSLLSGVKID